ncbi:MAG TPA: Crp/Fnr family transcriptional regulator [Rhizobacter sp.]
MSRMRHARPEARLDGPQREAVIAIARTVAPLDVHEFEPVLQAATARRLEAQDALLHAGDPDEREYFVLEGVLRTWLSDAQGRSVTLAFHVGPGIVMPAITRTADGRSRVHCEALTACHVAGFPSHTLVDCMRRSPSVQQWGDAVLRAELVRRADREWALAALPAAQRLSQFREQYPGLESRIAQRHIASYLGVTSVSLSRLRSQERGPQAPGRP